jgi:alpha-1,3-glucosyltransferase
MGLYYSLPVFVYILGLYTKNFQLMKKSLVLYLYDSGTKVLMVAYVVLATFLAIWYPWVFNLEELSLVLKAIFPVHRGLYQLKVANFWCFTNMLIKWERIFSPDFLVKLSILLTLMFSLPSLIVIYFNPRNSYFVKGLFNVSLAFFFFSYHVHEKTILLPLAMLVLNAKSMGSYLFDFISFSTFTLYHLLKEDK